LEWPEARFFHRQKHKLSSRVLKPSGVARELRDAGRSGRHLLGRQTGETCMKKFTCKF